MAKLRLRYVNEYIDQTGKLRRYFRKGKRQMGALPGEVGSEEFMTAYQAFLAAKPELVKRHMHAESLGRLIVDYYASRMYTDLKASTRQAYRYALDPVAKEHGHRSVRLMTADHAERIIGKIGDLAPGMGNLTRAVMRRVMQFAIKQKRRKDNPFLAVESYKVGEHHTWTDIELRQFETAWRLGTRERLAYALLLFTGQRVGDVTRMTRADVADGLIHVVQQKTGAELWVPIHPDLLAAMKAYPARGLTLFGDTAGRPLRRAALSSLMRGAIREAGLPSRCVAHGLRKAAMRRLAEAGSTVNQISAISGHKTLKEVQRYTDAADQRTLARAAIGKLKIDEQ